MLCNWRKLWRMAEVGVDRGDYAALFLDRWMGHQYFGIDPYLPFAEQDYDREADFLFAVEALRRHAGRVKLIRKPSALASALFPADWLDFVYVDGAHDADSVAADLSAWWPKVSARGIMAGHDWDGHPEHRGVKSSVEAFARERGLTVYLTNVDGYGQEDCGSWYVYKSGMPGPEWRRC